MKKILTFLLIACLGISVCLMLTACSDTEDDFTNSSSDYLDNYNPSSSGSSNSGSSSSGSSSSGSSSSGSSSSGSSSSGNYDISFSEKIVVDNSECVIKITEIKETSIFGFAINLELENKSTSKTYVFTTSDMHINGVDCSASFYAEVAPSKKANEKIYIYKSSFKNNDIGIYSDIEITFRAYNSDDFLEDDVVNETVHIYPYGQNNAFIYNRPMQPTDEILVDNDYVKIIVTGYEMDDIYGYIVSLYLINKTDKELMFNVDDASINGFMVEPYFAKDVSAGKQAFAEIDWSVYTLEDNNIKTVEEIEFLLEVYDINNIFGEYYVESTITLIP